MGTYLIFSRFSSESFRDLKDVKQLAAAVSERIKAECPGVRWKDSWATTGHFDVVDDQTRVVPVIKRPVRSSLRRTTHFDYDLLAHGVAGIDLTPLTRV